MIPYREGGASLVAQKVENSPTIWEDLGSIPGWGRSSGGHSNPLQLFFLENPHGQRSLVGCSLSTGSQSWTQLSD